MSALKMIYPQYEAELEITERCGAQYAEALTGKADPLQLLFPGGGLQTAEKLYQNSPSAKAYNSLIKTAVEGFMENIPADGFLRVLEIGGGTGGTSSYVLPSLQADRTEYIFTDISPLFIARAQQKFNHFPFVKYQMVDIEKNPVAQGLPENYFDLIIAANVIHATADLHATLQHIYQLLKPNGLFIMLEVTAPQRWVDLTFGLTNGWWRFTDRDLRPAYPLLSQAKWLDLLHKEGFDDAAAVPQAVMENTELSSQMLEEAVILARRGAVRTEKLARRWLVFSDKIGIGLDLQKRLEGAGEIVSLVYPGDSFRRNEDGSWLIRADQVEDYRSLLKNTSPLSRVVHLWSLDQDSPLELSVEISSVLHLVQALASAEEPDEMRLWLVTGGAQMVAENQSILNVGQAPLWGLGEVIRLEHPELGCVMIDLPSLEPSGLPEPGNAQKFLKELLAPDKEYQVGYRDGQRYVRRLKHLPKPATAQKQEAIQAQRLEITNRGSLDALVWQPFERARPGIGQVEIEVHATGLNFKDVLNALGMYPGEAGMLGGECAGVITALGEGVSDLHVGDEVIAIAAGCFSSHVLAQADFVLHKPQTVTYEQAAGLAIPYITAEYALNQLGEMKAGEKVLIHAGAGGVGLAAIQLAQRCGAEIFATAGNPEKRAYLKTLGVQHVLDSRSLAFADEIMEITRRAELTWC